MKKKKKKAIKKVSFYYFHIIITISFNVCCHKSSDMVAYFFSFIVENWTTNLAFGFFFSILHMLTTEKKILFVFGLFKV